MTLAQPGESRPQDRGPERSPEPPVLICSQELRPGSVAKVERSETLVSEAESAELYGVNARIIAEVDFEESKYFVADVSNDPRFRAELIVMDNRVQAPTRENPQGHGFVEIGDDGIVGIGRSSHGDRFDYSNRLSRHHFNVEAERDRINIHGVQSRHGGRVRWPQQPQIVAKVETPPATDSTTI